MKLKVRLRKNMHCTPRGMLGSVSGSLMSLDRGVVSLKQRAVVSALRPTEKALETNIVGIRADRKHK